MRDQPSGAQLGHGHATGRIRRWPLAIRHSPFATRRPRRAQTSTPDALRSGIGGRGVCHHGDRTTLPRERPGPRSGHWTRQRSSSVGPSSPETGNPTTRRVGAPLAAHPNAGGPSRPRPRTADRGPWPVSVASARQRRHHPMGGETAYSSRACARAGRAPGVVSDDSSSRRFCGWAAAPDGGWGHRRAIPVIRSVPSPRSSPSPAIPIDPVFSIEHSTLW